MQRRAFLSNSPRRVEQRYHVCDWCGHAHERTVLCAQRPTWGRRGFLALFGSGLAGLALHGLASPTPGVCVWPNPGWPPDGMLVVSSVPIKFHPLAFELTWPALPLRPSFTQSHAAIQATVRDLANCIDQDALEKFYQASQWPRP